MNQNGRQWCGASLFPLLTSLLMASFVVIPAATGGQIHVQPSLLPNVMNSDATRPGAPDEIADKAALSSLRSAQSHLLFEKNAGQWSAPALFRAHAGGYEAFVAATGLAMVQTKPVPAPESHNGLERFGAPEEAPPREQWAVLMTLVDGNPAPLVTTDAEDAFHTNYFIGNDPTQWHTNVPHFHAVTLRGVYPGIDMAYHAGADGGLEYDFIVHPGADPAAIQQRFEGATSIQADQDGTLSLATGLGVIRQGAPTSWQADGARVDNRYDISGDVVRFNVGGRDASQALVIDPLVYSTYLGGQSGAHINGVAADASGSAYVTGGSSGSDYPTTPGAYKANANDGAFVTKLNAGGSTLAYSAFLGGGGAYGSDIAVDAGGNAYMAGRAGPGFPTTLGAYQTTISGSGGIIVKLNPTGSVLVYSTYLGGVSDAPSIAIDSGGMAYIAGTGHPATTPGAFQTTPPWVRTSSDDGFVTKLNAAGSALAYSTYLGGSGQDQTKDIAVDASGNAYVTTWTDSSDFPITDWIVCCREDRIGNYVTFVTKLNPSGSALAYSTYMGGPTGWDGNSIAVDSSGSAYFTGNPDRGNFEVTSGAYRTTAGGSGDGFVAKLTASGHLAYSTYLGGQYLYAEDVALDPSGDAYVTGTVGEGGFIPASSGAYQESSGGGNDAFLLKLNAAGSALPYATYLGGPESDDGDAVAVDLSGKAYIIGTPWGVDFPTYSAYQPTSPSIYSVGFVAKVDPVPFPAPTLSAVPGPGAGQITLSWSEPSSSGGSSITGYAIYGGSASGQERRLTVGGCSGLGNVRTCTDGGLGDGVPRFYKVSAFTALGEGARSTEVGAITAIPPSAPQHLFATRGPNPGEITLRWQSPANTSGITLTYNV
ncbi:MAG: hypothetical protein QOI63_615, partial [Thermoplasmata archaeon]|nr:hypothetical protein [Thermoplasmata archaeon]